MTPWWIKHVLVVLHSTIFDIFAFQPNGISSIYKLLKITSASNFMGNKFVTIWNSQFSNCSSEWSISIWLKSHLYWYVIAWEIWGNHYRSHVSDSMYHPMKSEETITGHMWVILCIIQWKWRDYDSVTKLLCILQATLLFKKCHTQIYHIHLYLFMT